MRWSGPSEFSASPTTAGSDLEPGSRVLLSGGNRTYKRSSTARSRSFAPAWSRSKEAGLAPTRATRTTRRPGSSSRSSSARSGFMVVISGAHAHDLRPRGVSEAPATVNRALPNAPSYSALFKGRLFATRRSLTAMRRRQRPRASRLALIPQLTKETTKNDLVDSC